MTLANTGAANSCLVGAVISDPLPVGIEPAAGTIQLAVNGGAPVPVPDGAYDRGTRTIAVTCGDLWGGGSAALTFEAAVEADALGQDAANIAHAHGGIPSEDPGSVPSGPDPGNPFRPEEGWDEYARDHESVATDPVYPPGVTARGGILQDADDSSTARKKDSTTIRHRLAQTGDALAAASGTALTLALAAGALALASRRRARQAR